MNEQTFWFIFWSVILICIVVLTYFLVKVLYELSKDLRKLRVTIKNMNEASGYIVDGTEKASNAIGKATSAVDKVGSTVSALSALRAVKLARSIFSSSQRKSKSSS